MWLHTCFQAFICVCFFSPLKLCLVSRLLRAGDVTVHPADSFSMALFQPHAPESIPYSYIYLCTQMPGWLHYEVFLALNLFIKFVYTPLIAIGCDTPTVFSNIVIASNFNRMKIQLVHIFFNRKVGIDISSRKVNLEYCHTPDLTS